MQPHAPHLALERAKAGADLDVVILAQAGAHGGLIDARRDAHGDEGGQAVVGGHEGRQVQLGQAAAKMLGIGGGEAN